MINKKINRLWKVQFLIIMLAISFQAANAETYELLGQGVCRAAGNSQPKSYTYKNYSWEKCREVCSSRGCSGIEYNIRNDRSVCEHHYAPVRVKPTTSKDRIHTCWARTVEQGLVAKKSNGASVHGILVPECTWTNDNVASCLVWDCDADGVCVEYGTYCVDKYGQDVPCP